MTQPRIPAGASVFFGVGAPKKIVCETKRLVLKLSEKGFRGDIYFSNGFYEVGNGCISRCEQTKAHLIYLNTQCHSPVFALVNSITALMDWCESVGFFFECPFDLDRIGRMCGN